MNSKERVLKTLNYEKADHIAMFDEYWPEFEEKCKQELGLDANTKLVDYFGVDIAIVEPDECPYPHLRELLSINEDCTVARNGWGVIERTRKGAYFSEELDFLIKSCDDLKKFPFESPEIDERYQRFIKKVEAEKAKGRCVFGKIGGPYIRSTFIRGQTNFLMDVASDEGFARELAFRIGDFLMQVGKEEIVRGNLYDTGIWISDDMAYNLGTMVSPKSFEKIFYPIYKRMVTEFKKMGVAKVGLHSDGDIRPVLDMLVDVGIDLINPVEPKAGMSIKELKTKYGKKLAYVGGMCNADVLVNGPEERIKKQTSEIIELAQDGGVIIGSHSIGPEVPVNNYLTYIQCIRNSY